MELLQDGVVAALAAIGVTALIPIFGAWIGADMAGGIAAAVA